MIWHLTLTPHNVCLWAALLSFFLAAVNVRSPVNLVALGLFSALLAFAFV